MQRYNLNPNIFLLLQMQNLTNIILFPSENILKTELRGSKGDLKRPFDRALRDYQDKFSDLERTKKKQAKEAGMIRSELTAGEIAEETDKERKYLQIAAADYLVKVNEIKTKKGVEMLQHLVDYYRAQSRYVLQIDLNIFYDELKRIIFAHYQLGYFSSFGDESRQELAGKQLILQLNSSFSERFNG